MFEDVKVGNAARSFDTLQQQRLGHYVYALIDPRDSKIFYVGQGHGNRLFDHFAEAQTAISENLTPSSKVIRILDIWKNEEDVVWHIIAHNLPEGTRDFVESAVIDALLISQNGQCLNVQGGPRSTSLSSGEVSTLGATKVNPEKALSHVFVFPIHNVLESSWSNVYEATRASWTVASHYRNKNVHAVGVKNGISIGGYRIDSWEKQDKKYAFIGTDAPELAGLDWKNVIDCAKGYWQRGNYLISEFDGNGKFRIVRGSASKSEWISCE